MHLARARWWSGGFLLLVLCASFAAVPPTAAVPGVGASYPVHPPSEQSKIINAPPLPAFTPGAPPQPDLAAPATLPLAFYERRDGFVAITGDLTARFEPEQVSLTTADAALSIQFLGLSNPVHPRGEMRQSGVGNFLLGADPKGWENNVPVFGRLRYSAIYPNVDLVYRGEGTQLKADWMIGVGAQPSDMSASISRIRWTYPGTRRVKIETDGSLRIETEAGVLHEGAPLAYQTVDGERRVVASRFLLQTRADGTTEVGFAAEGYDPALELVIDPALSYSTYVGGTKNDAATSIALDADGSVYVAGYTESANFPSVSAMLNFASSVDAFVMKLSASGTTLVYATFIGGIGDDRALGIDTDSAGAAYVVGSTTSNNFPLRAPLQPNIGGGRDAFLLKLNAAGNALVYSTYFGGFGTDSAYAIDVDPFGQPYVAGETSSTNFPLKLPFQSVNRGGLDIFTLKVNAAGALVYSTYLGGTGDDGARGIAVSTNQLTPYLTGYTWSTDFPLWNPSQAFNGGGQDAFVVRFNSDADALVFSSYLGGSGGTPGAPELGQAIALDPFNNVYVAGTTSSTNFPLLLPYQAVFGGGGQDAWLRKLDSGGVLVYSTLLGGVGVDIATSLKVDANRRAYVAGYTSSSNFPLVSPTQSALGGSYDAFVTEFESTGKTLVYSTVVGGTSADIAYGVAADSTNGNTYLAGSTTSVNFPVAAGYRFSASGANDAFVTKITPGVIPPTAPAFLGITPNSGSGATTTFTIQVADANGANTIDSQQFLVNSRFTGVNSCHIAYVPATNLFFVLNNAATAWLGGLPPGTNTSISNSQCSLNVKNATSTKLGNVFTLSFPITFSPTYPGTKFLYMLAVDQGGLRADWATYGIWTSP